MPASAAIETGMNENAVPAPARMKGPSRLPRKWPWTGTWVAQITPAPIRLIPTAITGRGSDRVTSSWETPASAIEVQGRRQPRKPGLQRAEVQHLLHVQRADEQERVEAAAQQQRRLCSRRRASAAGRSRAAESATRPGSRSPGTRRAARRLPPAPRSSARRPSRTAAPGRSRRRAAPVRRCRRAHRPRQSAGAFGGQPALGAPPAVPAQARRAPIGTFR